MKSGTGYYFLRWMDITFQFPDQTAAKAVAYLCTSEADDLHGVDFSIKTEEGRARLGL